MNWKTLVFGSRLATGDDSGQKLGVFAGVPAVGLDGLASSAYGPEAALTILIPLGVVAPAYLRPVVGCVLVLLVVLYLSYRQTIAAYPGGGGSYTVAKENLGVTVGLFAAAALMIDYVLNVAVAISAGVAALTSAVPALHPHTLGLCLAILVLLTVVNLRGTSEAGVAFALPTYVFLGSFVAVLGIGLFKATSHGGAPTPVVTPPPIKEAAEALSFWLLMRSFASGCTAMTGVEAVSNGVTAFKDPAVDNARRTLTVICVMLGLLLAGEAVLCRSYHVGAMDQNAPGYQTVLSQLAAAVVGRGVFYYVAMASLLSVLALSANTSFVGFPRLSRLVARDQFLPHGFAVAGRRLVFSVGILVLAAAAGALLLAFGGITDRLIPLFAVGAFGAFTASQAGMVVHWRRTQREKKATGREAWHNRVRLAVNGVGAAATGLALAVIVVAKFVEGAWITILLLPLMVLMFYRIRLQRRRTQEQTRTGDPLDPGDDRPPVILLPTDGWNRPTAKSLQLAMRLSPDVTAVHLRSLDGDSDDADAELRVRWAERVEAPARAAGRPVPRLAIVSTPYREFCDPLLAEIAKLKAEFPGRQIAVMVPEVVKRRWWQFLLHGYRAERLRLALLQHGDKQLLVINVPWYLETPDDPQPPPACDS